jgi:hypothetical protein
MNNPIIHRLLAQSNAQHLRDAGASARRGRDAATARRAAARNSEVTLRFAFPDDEQALARLAALDCARPPAAPVLVAEAGGALRAALSLADGAVVADPFHPTEALITLLRARAAQLLAVDAHGRRERGRARPAFRAWWA